MYSRIIVFRKKNETTNLNIALRIAYKPRLCLISVNDKSSAAGDPLTDPGEYENLPFHGMQSAPNKVSYICNLYVILFKLHQ